MRVLCITTCYKCVRRDGRATAAAGWLWYDMKGKTNINQRMT